MYYMDFGSAEEVSVDTAAMGAEVGGGGGANINVIPKSGGNTVKGDVNYSITGKGYWDHFTGNNITDDLRAQGITDPRCATSTTSTPASADRSSRTSCGGSGRTATTTRQEATAGYTIVNRTTP